MNLPSSTRPKPPSVSSLSDAPDELWYAGDRSARPQIGLLAMLLLVVVFAMMSAGMVYAAKIPEIQEEWAVLWGTKATVDRTSHGPQMLFILFTFSSPLLLATLLSSVLAMRNAIGRR